jgi:hypothetical protein
VSDQPRGRAWRWLYRPITPGAARAVVTLFILSFLLSGAAWWLAVRAVQGEIASRASVVQLCRAGNEARAQQVILWTHLVAASASPPRQTAAQKAARDKLIRNFLAYVRTVFAPRDCR